MDGGIGPVTTSPAATPVTGSGAANDVANTDGTFGLALDQVMESDPEAKATGSTGDSGASSGGVGSMAATAPAAASFGPTGSLNGLDWAPGSGPGTGCYTGVWPKATGNMMGGWPTYQGQAPTSIFEPESGQVLATYPDGTVVDLAKGQVASAGSSGAAGSSGVGAVSTASPAGSSGVGASSSGASSSGVSTSSPAASVPAAGAESRSVMARAETAPGAGPSTAASQTGGPTGTLDGLKWAPGSGPGTGHYNGVWPGATGNMIGGWPTYQGQPPSRIFEPESGQVLATYPDGAVVDLAIGEVLDPGAG